MFSTSDEPCDAKNEEQKAVCTNNVITQLMQCNLPRMQRQDSKLPQCNNNTDLELYRNILANLSKNNKETEKCDLFLKTVISILGQLRNLHPGKIPIEIQLLLVTNTVTQVIKSNICNFNVTCINTILFTLIRLMC